MINPADMAERHGEILAELSALALTLARDLQARAIAASDDAATCDLSLAFHRVSRSLRQTLALEVRLERERRLGLREDAQEAQRETLARVQKKRSQVRNVLERAVWDEAEGEEAETLRVWSPWCSRPPRTTTSWTSPIEACIERIRKGLGLAAASAAAADAANRADPSVVIWRSSG